MRYKPGLEPSRTQAWEEGKKGQVKSPYPLIPLRPLPTVSPPNNPATLSDPGPLQARKALGMANAINHLVNGGPNGNPDWDRIRGNGGPSTGGNFVKASLESIKKRLDPAKPISVILGMHINDAIQIITSLIDTAKSAGAAPDALDAQKPKVEKLVSDLQQLVTSTNLLLQQTGSSPAGLVTPAAPQGTITPNAGKIAIASEKFVVNRMRGKLRASHEAFDKASERLSEGQNAVTKIISGMTPISLSDASLKAKLQKTQGMLQESSTAAIQGITSQVNDEQKKFSGAIDQRLHNIGESVRDVPAIAAPVAENIKMIITAHLKDFGAAQAAQSKNNAMFGADGAM
ncbi:hypothetical protein FRC01_010662 [Tulasnella sp. 417]|nr:hypothetical protein FRC01_010662 [Tulasnella sp. 417]